MKKSKTKAEQLADRIIKDANQDLDLGQIKSHYGESHTTSARARRIVRNGHPEKTTRPKRKKSSSVSMTDAIMEEYEQNGKMPESWREITDKFDVSKATAGRVLTQLRKRRQEKNVREKSRKPSAPKQQDPQVIRIELEVPEKAEIKLRRNGVFCTIIATEDGAAFLPSKAKKMTKIVSWERLYKLAEVLS